MGFLTYKERRSLNTLEEEELISAQGASVRVFYREAERVLEKEWEQNQAAAASDRLRNDDETCI